MGIIREQKLSKSAKGNVDNLLAKDSLQLREQQVHRIRIAMEAVVYGVK